MKIKRQTLSQSGASAIEFAIVLPVLLILLLGIIEFSVLFYDQAMITNASREGARFGVAYPGSAGPPDLGEITTRVNEYLGVDGTGSSLLISFDGTSSPSTARETPDGGEATGQRLRVTVTYDYGWLILPDFVTDLGVGRRTLTATSEMRFE